MKDVTASRGWEGKCITVTTILIVAHSTHRRDACIHTLIWQERRLGRNGSSRYYGGPIGLFQNFADAFKVLTGNTSYQKRRIRWYTMSLS